MIRGRGTVQTAFKRIERSGEFGAPEVRMRVEVAEAQQVRLCRIDVVDGVEDDILTSGEEVHAARRAALAPADALRNRAGVNE